MPRRDRSVTLPRHGSRAPATDLKGKPTMRLRIALRRALRTRARAPRQQEPQLIMSDRLSYTDVLVQLTPRQDRIEDALVRILSAGGTRSELRDVVHQYADLLRLQGVSADRAIGSLKAVVHRALPKMWARNDSTAGDSAADFTAMSARWCAERFQQADDR